MQNEITITQIFESYIGNNLLDYIYEKQLKSHYLLEKSKEFEDKFKWLSVDVETCDSDGHYKKESQDISKTQEIKEIRYDVKNLIDRYEDLLYNQIKQTVYICDFMQIIEIYFQDNSNLFNIGELLNIFDGLDNKCEFANQLDGLAKSNDEANKKLFLELLNGLTI